MLKDIRLQDERIRVFLGQRHQRAGAAHNAPCWRKDRGGEAEFAQRAIRFFVGGVIARHAELRRDFPDFITWPALTRISTLGWRAKKADDARRERGRVDRLGAGSGNRRVRRTSREIGFDEAGINRQSLRVPNARVGGRWHVPPDGFNEPVANHNGCAFQHFAWSRNDLATDNCMDAGRKRTKTGRKQFGDGAVAGESTRDHQRAKEAQCFGVVHAGSMQARAVESSGLCGSRAIRNRGCG